MKKLFTLICIVAAGMLAVSCTSDDDAVAAVLPVYKDVVFIQNGEEVSARSIAAGQMVTARLVQASKGSGIYRYTYQWKCNDEQAGLSVFKQEKNDSEEAVCEFLPATAGDYKLTINIDYNYSGNRAPKTPSVTIPNGTVIYHVGGELYGKATVTKDITIR